MKQVGFFFMGVLFFCISPIIIPTLLFRDLGKATWEVFEDRGWV